MSKRQKAQQKNAGSPNAPAVISEKLVERLAERYMIPAAAFLDSIRSTIFAVKQGDRAFTDAEVAAALILCEQYDLNPFAREIYVTRNPKTGLLLVIVPIDGWVKICLRQENFDGVEFEYEENEDELDDDGNPTPVSCTAVVHVKGRSHPIRITEYFAECYRDTGPWNHWPRRMLRHKAYIQAIRYGFGLSEAVDEDEAERIGVRIPEYNVKDSNAAIAPPKARRKAATEVRAEPEEDSPPRDLGEKDVESDAALEAKRKHLVEIRETFKNFTAEEQIEVREAAGVELMSMDCNLAQLEAAARKASEIAEGKRE